MSSRARCHGPAGKKSGSHLSRPRQSSSLRGPCPRHDRTSWSGLVGGCNGWGAVFCEWLQDRQERATHVVIALGSNVHIFVCPHLRGELTQCIETIVGSPVRTVEFPASVSRCLLSAFPAGDISASSSPMRHPMMSSRVWVPGLSCALMLQAALAAGLPEVKHPGPSVLLHDSWRPGVHHRPNELNAAISDGRNK